MLVGGLEYPKAYAAAGAVWLVGRVLYAVGYKNSKHGSKGEGRHIGAIGPVVQLGMMVGSLWVGYKLAMGI